VEPAKSLQSTDFETGEPAFWDAEKQRPKMAAVINVKVLEGPHSVGEDRSIWAQIPSNLFMALKEAQSKAEARFAPGGLLQIRFAGTKKHENPRFSPIKQYEAQYDSRGHTLTPDPFIPAQPPQEGPPQAAQATQAPRAAWRSAPQPTTPPEPAQTPTSGRGWRR
jgi:hypothetical protein